MWKLPNGNITSFPKPITINGTQYSKKIFTEWTTAELNAIGIYPFIEKRYDDKYYRSIKFKDVEKNGVITRTHTIVKRYTITQIKKQFRDEIRQVAHEYIKRYHSIQNYLKEFEPNNTTEIAEWDQWLADLKTAYQTIKTELAALTIYKDVIDYIQSGWQKHIPIAPDETQI
ncbi:MAG: hypothetical protein ACE5HX_04220 [bacterium]